MTSQEYNNLPVGQPTEPVDIGSKFRIKDKSCKSGDHVSYYKVIRLTYNGYESMAMYSVLE